MTDTLKILIDNREKEYIKRTDEILLKIGLVLTDAANKFYGNTNPVDWNTVEYVQGLPNYVRVIGFALPSLGMAVNFDDESITITEENQHIFRQIAKFIIPIQLLELNDSEKIAKYLFDVAQLSVVLSEHELLNMLKNYTDFDKDISNTVSYDAVLDIATKPSDVFGFDGKMLNDEQIKSLYLNGIHISGTKN